MEGIIDHFHCIRCKKPMEISERTRDGICLECKKKDEEKYLKPIIFP